MTDTIPTREAKAIESIENAVFEALDARMDSERIHEEVDKAIEVDRRFQASRQR